MNRIRRDHLWKVWALMAIAVTGVALWRLSQHREARRAVEQLRSELTALRRQRAEEVNALAQLRQQLEQQRGLSAAATAQLNQALEQVSVAVAPSLWTEPPEQLPDWNPASPFVWLNKSSLTNLPVEVFDGEGRIGTEFAAILAIPPEKLTQLNRELVRFLQERQASEPSRAEVSEEHLPGIAGDAGEKLTIKVAALPEDSTRLKREFEELLHHHLGDGRAELVQSTGSEWISSHFSQFGNEPRIISVCRFPNGTYSLAIKSGLIWFSTGGLRDISHHVPAHLRSLFSSITERQPEHSDDAP